MEDSNDKVFGILSYLAFLVLIPLAVGKSQFSKFHANQGLILLIVEIVFGAIIGIGAMIPVIRIIFIIIGSIFELACLLMAIFGIVNAVNGETKELPIIGSIRLIK